MHKLGIQVRSSLARRAGTRLRVGLALACYSFKGIFKASVPGLRLASNVRQGLWGRTVGGSLHLVAKQLVGT